ncbi:carboxylesterase family protein [Nocardia sp. R6R-6]|uniref:carboxylesterase family protein n=1 Tax=Nocardia sp. R6R-6 TaxID=3459303 RepID=UPI00403DB778
MEEMMLVKTTTGSVVGATTDGVSAFPGVRYGRLANGRRFDPVAPANGAESKQDLRDLSAVFPQLPSRLSAAMGGAVDAHPQEEDAFLLNIWTPAGVSGLPVLVYVHGGAFISGGGGVRWYNGHVLARDGAMVVVTVNFRLGPLAHLALGTDDDPNRALGDLLEALRWVRENIALFGGDPDNITLAGQSSGAFFTKLLGVLPASRQMLRRLCILSCPGIPAATPEQTAELSAQIIRHLDGADPRTAPVGELLQGHRLAMMNNGRFGTVGMGLMPTSGSVVPDWLDDPREVAAALRVTDLMVSVTRDETTAFFFAGPERHITREQLVQVHGAAADVTGDPYRDLVELTTAVRFVNPARELAEAAAARGINTQLREFTVASPLDGLGSGHGVDIPFLFGNWDDWADAPMMHGFDRDQFVKESEQLRSAVADLVHGRMKAST